MLCEYPIKLAGERMMRKALFILLCSALGGCATSPSATATCTNLISTGGGLLKYCQTGRQIDVTESGIDPSAEPVPVKVVDDPAVLNGLQHEAGLHEAFSASRKLVARACVVGKTDYLTVSVDDIKRMLSKGRTPQAAAPADAPSGGAPQAGEPG